MAFRKIRIKMRILVLVSIFLSFISTKAMHKEKNRGCTNQVLSALSYFFEYEGQESHYRYGRVTYNRAEITDLSILVGEQALHYSHVDGLNKESLVHQAKILCLQKKGFHFLRSNNIFAAAISPQSNINMQTIVDGLKQKYGARITCSADADGYFFQGTLDNDCTGLTQNLQNWMN